MENKNFGISIKLSFKFFKLLQQQLSKLSSFYVRATNKHVCQVWVRSFRSTPFFNTIILPGQRCRMKLTLSGHPLSPSRCNEKVFWNCKRQTPRTISFLSSTNSLFLSLYTSHDRAEMSPTGAICGRWGRRELCVSRWGFPARKSGFCQLARLQSCQMTCHVRRD